MQLWFLFKQQLKLSSNISLAAVCVNVPYQRLPVQHNSKCLHKVTKSRRSFSPLIIFFIHYWFVVGWCWFPFFLHWYDVSLFARHWRDPSRFPFFFFLIILRGSIDKRTHTHTHTHMHTQHRKKEKGGKRERVEVAWRSKVWHTDSLLAILFPCLPNWHHSQWKLLLLLLLLLYMTMTMGLLDPSLPLSACACFVFLGQNALGK